MCFGVPFLREGIGNMHALNEMIGERLIVVIEATV